MREPGTRRVWIETLALVSLSLFFYKVGVLFFLFLIPFQIMYERHGYKQLLYGAAIFIGVSALFAASSVSRLELRELANVLLVLEIAIPGLFILGVLVLNSTLFPWKRTLPRILGSTGVAALLSIPLIMYVGNNEGFNSFFNSQFEQMMSIFNLGTAGEESFEASVMERMFQGDEFLLFLKDMVFRNYVFIYFIIFSGNWLVGSNVVRRSRGNPRFSIAYFRNPEVFVWPLLISWAMVLLDVVIRIGFLSYLFWNSGLIFLFLFGVQGAGIIRFLFNKYRLSRGLRLLISFILVVFMFIPGINLVIFIGIPGLGVSELWIHYRKLERS